MTRLLLTILLLLPAVHAAERPNVAFILADDMGYGEAGCYGQKLMATPQIDRLAAEGMRFTQFYAGSAVCAPSRSVFLTGQHTGHTRVRGNAGRQNSAAQTLQAGDVTVAEVLKQAGYTTAVIGKWGLGTESNEGDPLKQGFDHQFGFISQTHAHNHYPDFLWRDGRRITLPNDRTQVGEVEGTGYATKPVAYANDLFFDEAQTFIAQHRAGPFFLFLALTTPHANNERARTLGDGNEVPDYAPYAGRPWNDSQKGHAAMVTRMDRQIGELMDRLRELGIDRDTIVIFSSDNGAHREGGPNYDPAFFNASGPLSGIKRDLLEGGIREPFIVRWPGRVAAGAVSGHVGYFGDLMATLAELAGARAPSQLDSISFVPALLGHAGQRRHDYLYWELYEGGLSQAVLFDGRWKAIRAGGTEAPVRLYDLADDLRETKDVAAANPAIVARAREALQAAHVDNEFWKLRSAPAAAP